METRSTKLVKKLMQELHLKNTHQVPAITKVVINVGVGKQRGSDQAVTAIAEDLKAISGQKSQERPARQAVSGFTVRQGEVVGLRVTLRGKKMVDFIEKFVHMTLPRVRDFRGISPQSLDGLGNLNVGLNDQMAFPEIRPEKTDIVFGLQVTFATTARDNQKGQALFQAWGFPLISKEE